MTPGASRNGRGARLHPAIDRSRALVAAHSASSLEPDLLGRLSAAVELVAVKLLELTKRARVDPELPARRCGRRA